jgi:hypothetical protein
MPQSESNRQSDATQWLPGPESQAHVAPVAQSASLVHWSYEHEQTGMAPVGPQRPLVPAVQSVSNLQELLA